MLVLEKCTGAFLLKNHQCVYKSKNHQRSYNYYASVLPFYVVCNIDALIIITHRFCTFFLYEAPILF
jgi:hypothetical protein